MAGEIDKRIQELDLSGSPTATHTPAGRFLYSIGDIDVYSKTDTDPPYVIAPVDDPCAVEAALPKGWTIGNGWWASDPSQKQPDGRWLLYFGTIRDYLAGPQGWKLTNG